MIESEEKRKRLTEIVARWTKHTKVKPYLRNCDIPSLVSSILGEFYRITLCCGHMVRELDEGVGLAFNELEGTTHGSYCKDCAKKYKKDLQAWEI